MVRGLLEPQPPGYSILEALLEPASWPCVGAQVKERTIRMKQVVDFGPIHGNVYKLLASFSSLSIVPYYQYQYIYYSLYNEITE